VKTSRPFVLLLVLLVVLCSGLAARIDCWFVGWPGNHEQSLNPLDVMIGDGQKLFAGSFYREADVYYHSGYYPTIFDNRGAFETAHMAEDTGAVASHNEGDEAGFMSPPLDFIDAFNRHFIPNRHSHLDEGGPTDNLGKSQEVREILPWLKMSSELDPENIQTYIVTAYWLRTRMGKVAEGEQVLREGLRYNPNNPQLLYELGRVYFENYHDLQRARNIWEAALRSWKAQMAGKPDSEKFSFDNKFLLEQLQAHLALLEEAAGHFDAAIAHLEQAKAVSPNPGGLQRQIDELKNKPGVTTNAPAATSR
jgi:tetratricopeptide (TPR) repeat protein